MQGPAAARMLFLDPAVEVAVIDVPPKEALAYGLGYDWADACAVINDEPIESPDLVDALRLVATSARGHLIVSEKDEETYRLKAHPDARVKHVSPAARASTYATALAQALASPAGEIERKPSKRSTTLVP